MDKNPLITIIVPVYKVEQYLDRCLDSLVNQTYNNLEIILVDDGSPDACSQMCDDWAKKDTRIKVIHKENGGLSDARNAGMKISTGEYIAFVDSDDWIDLKTYSLVMDKMLLVDAQIGAFNIINVDSSDLKPDFSAEYQILNSEQAIENTIDDIGVKTVAWNKVYHRSILKNLSFPKGKLHEDEFFTFHALDRAEKIVYLHRQCYYYFQRPTSIMGHYNIRHIDMLEGVKQRMEFVEQNYPHLYRKAKLSFSLCCMVQYQNLLRNKSADANGSGRSKVKLLRKSVTIAKSDVEGLEKRSALFHRFTNSSFGLDAVCKIRNLMKR